MSEASGFDKPVDARERSGRAPITERSCLAMFDQGPGLITSELDQKSARNRNKTQVIHHLPSVSVSPMPFTPIPLTSSPPPSSAPLIQPLLASARFAAVLSSGWGSIPTRVASRATGCQHARDARAQQVQRSTCEIYSFCQSMRSHGRRVVAYSS
ncbi:hypothetical protein BaRGS_00038737 [Batillaria attramentaria]|uniref:Uncharacterized protein n=1 Tax=Batillaria attramentaria TaxID=370345 RepID=A0ABD0J5X6_9CAEN